MSHLAQTSRGLVDPVDALLSRLEGARKAGYGWMAQCPAHEDRTPSLSIRVGDDGRVLAHCFAGCSTAEVVASVGMSLADLFPRTHAGRSSQRRAARRSLPSADHAAALRVIRRETMIFEIAAATIRSGGKLALDDIERVNVAVRNIRDAIEALQ